MLLSTNRLKDGFEHASSKRKGILDAAGLALAEPRTSLQGRWTCGHRGAGAPHGAAGRSSASFVAAEGLQSSSSSPTRQVDVCEDLIFCRGTANRSFVDTGLHFLSRIPSLRSLDLCVPPSLTDFPFSGLPDKVGQIHHQEFSESLLEGSAGPISASVDLDFRDDRTLLAPDSYRRRTFHSEE